MARESRATEELMVVISTALGFSTMFFGLGILWSYAVGAQSLTSIIVAAIISVILGVFIGVSTFGSQSAGMGARMMLIPILGIFGIVGGVVWAVRVVS